MSVDEILVFLASIYFSVVFLLDWYAALAHAEMRTAAGRTVKKIFLFVPLLALLTVSFVLYRWASFDVIDDSLYLLFYMFIWFFWMKFSLQFMFMFFDISWADDAISLQNSAAAAAVLGGVFGSCAVYSGANIGDGPGWWCVFFAGFLGMFSWYLLARAVNALTGVFEKITIERDFSCGVRFGAYLLASGIILGRASGGDWTSAYMTIIEFGAGWPVLILTAAAAGAELVFFSKPGASGAEKNMIFSYLTGFVYLLSAVIAVSLLPSIVY